MGCFHYNNYILGNIKNDSYSSIWKNKKHLSFIKSQKKGEIKMCENCISGTSRNATLYQSVYRYLYFTLTGKGFDDS